MWCASASEMSSQGSHGSSPDVSDARLEGTMWSYLGGLWIKSCRAEIDLFSSATEPIDFLGTKAVVTIQI